MEAIESHPEKWLAIIIGLFLVDFFFGGDDDDSFDC